MRWALTETASRVAIPFAVLAVLILPGFAVGANTPAAVTVAVLALALAAVARVCLQGAGLAARVATVAPWNSDEAASVLSARVTDTLHHPLRPRAPGPA